MSTATLLPTSVHDADVAAATPPARHGRPAVDGGSAAVRAFLAHYSVTLLPLLAALVALEFGWELAAGTTWAAAAAAETGWALAVAGWLRMRGWRPSAVLLVTWAPAAVLAAPLAVGWLSPAGLVLWGPVTTVLTVALTLTDPPPASATTHPADLPAPA